MKKWVCGLEASYVEEKNKCLEIMRICTKFFDSQFFEELASKAKAESRKSVVQNNRSFGALRRCKQSIKSNGLDSIY